MNGVVGAILDSKNEREAKDQVFIYIDWFFSFQFYFSYVIHYLKSYYYCFLDDGGARFKSLGRSRSNILII